MSELSEAKRHYDWCIKRAMEEYDAGSATGAIASFVSDVGKHPGTAWILDTPMLLGLMRAEASRGREAFHQHLSGFTVI